MWIRVVEDPRSTMKRPELLELTRELRENQNVEKAIVKDHLNADNFVVFRVVAERTIPEQLADVTRNDKVGLFQTTTADSDGKMDLRLQARLE